MKIIPIVKIDGKNVPSEPIPSDAIRIASDGVNYTIYEAGDVIPPEPIAAPDPNADILRQITALEAQSQFTRKQREGIVMSETLTALDAEISALRIQLVR